MTQQELVSAIQKDVRVLKGSAPGNRGISQPYLSQIENGARPHLTNSSRMLLAKFFKVHPGYLVDDPEGYHSELLSEIRTSEDKLDLWLIAGAERFRRDPPLRSALIALSQHADSRKCLLLLEEVLKTPELVDRLLQVLRPEKAARPAQVSGYSAGSETPRAGNKATRIRKATP